MPVYYVKLPPDSPEEIRRNLGCFWGGIAVFVLYLAVILAAKPTTPKSPEPTPYRPAWLDNPTASGPIPSGPAPTPPSSQKRR